jgi:hypothetical protein
VAGTGRTHTRRAGASSVIRGSAAAPQSAASIRPRLPGMAENGDRLGSWVVRQRQLRVGGRLSTSRVRRLEALPGWVWDSNEADWERGFAALRQFVTREGHARISKTYVEGGYRLGAWAGVQRVAYNDGRLSDERIARLEALPGWVWKPLDTAWEAGYAALKQFADREGHTFVPQTHLEDGYRLGPWANTQRNFRSNGRLLKERAARLEALPGWEWEPMDARWEEGFTRLQEFVEREGHARVPSTHKERGYRLGQWVVVQRSFRQQARLSVERAARLDAVPGWVWHSKKADWERSFSVLERFVAREGHARVTAKHVEDGFPLGLWVVKQRSRREEFEAERQARLESLPGWVWITRAPRQRKTRSTATPPST